MSKQQKNNRNSSNRNTQVSAEQNGGAGAHHKKQSLTRILALLSVLAIVVSGVGFGVKIFGSVGMSVSDMDSTATGIGSQSAETSAAGTSAVTGTSAAAGTTAAATAATKSATTSAAKTSASSNAQVEHYIQPAGAVWYLKLVNPWNPLPSSYSPQLTDYSADKQYDKRAIDSLRNMIQAGSAYGLTPASLYRSIQLQTKLFNNEVASYTTLGYSQANAEIAAAKVVARPGTSEHNLGLAADILGSGYSSLETSFDTTPAFNWLKTHCAEYGFILRYPKDKVAITGVSYEPWHYRYVGVEAATEIMSRGITLEQYLQEKGE